MSSTNTDDQPEKQKEWHSADSLARQNSTVSPLLNNIIGGAARFSSSRDDSLVADDNLTPPVEAAVSTAQAESVLEDVEERSPNNEGQPTEEEIAVTHGSISEPMPDGEAIQPSPEAEEATKTQNTNQQPPVDPERPSLSEQYGEAGLLAELNALAETQQFQLAQHREYLLRSRAEQRQQIENWQQRCEALEEQLQSARDRATVLEQRHLDSQSQLLPVEAQRDAAQQVTESLQAEILDRRQQQISLEEQLDLAEATIREQQEISAAQSRGIVAMQAELSQAQAEVTALETRLSNQDHLRQQLKVESNRDRQDRSKARDRQLQLEQETTQMTGQLLRLSEELRQAQRQSNQWRRQAQTQAEQLREIAHWAAQAESVPPQLMALLEPLFRNPNETNDEQQLASSPENSTTPSVADGNNPTEVHQSSLDLPNFPHGTV